VWGKAIETVGVKGLITWRLRFAQAMCLDDTLCYLAKVDRARRPSYRSRR
jgi:hypothetical protein